MRIPSLIEEFALIDYVKKQKHILESKPQNSISNIYTSKFLLTIGLIQISTADATASWNTIVGTLGYTSATTVTGSTVHAVAAAYAQSILNSTPTCSRLSGAASNQTTEDMLSESLRCKDIVADLHFPRFFGTLIQCEIERHFPRSVVKIGLNVQCKISVF